MNDDGTSTQLNTPYSSRLHHLLTGGSSPDQTSEVTSNPTQATEQTMTQNADVQRSTPGEATTEAFQNGAMEANLVDLEAGDTSPSTVLLEVFGHRKSYGQKCLPNKSYSAKCCSKYLYTAALKGDLEEVKRLLSNDPKMLYCDVTNGKQNILHVAAGARQTAFVSEIMKSMSPEDLKLQDLNGNTAFCYAAAVGNVHIAKMMLEKNPELLQIRGGADMTPLYMAALFGERDMAEFLYDRSGKILEADRKVIFFISIESGLYDLALKLLTVDGDLAVACHVKHGTALHMLARNPSAFVATTPGLWQRLIKIFSGNKLTGNTEQLMSTPALELLELLWREIMQREDVDILELINKPSQLLFEAAKFGNFAVLAELIRSYPDLVYELDENDRSIFHTAVEHRNANILNLINEIGFGKELIASFVDEDGNNILHLAAKYPPLNSLNTISGAALEMQRELLIFKEVEKLVKPSLKQMRNFEGQTPGELFTISHAELLKRGENWMKSTAKTCILVAAFVAMAVFVTTRNNIDQMGKSISPRGPFFQVLAMADTIALCSSLISMLAFLSILTLQFKENDFLKALPVKLMVGLSTLFISVISVMVAFILIH